VGTPIWICAGRRWGKHRALQANFLWAVVTTLMLPLVPPGNLPVGIAFMMLAGMAQGGGILLTRALMADVVDEDELQTGARRSGLYFGLLLTTSKIAIVAGPLSLALLQLVGFDPQAGAVNSAGMLFALGAMFVLGPVIPQAIGIWLLQDYPLDEQAQAALAAAIQARHAAEDVKATLDAVVK
jgi:Na+/melibiose symporter-like transporter